MGLFGDIGKAFRSIGDVFGVFKKPKTPKVPPVNPPPPPQAARPPAPSRADPEVQEAGAAQRALFRRKGRRSTILTPGGGAGVGVGSTTQDVLGRTRR